MIETGESSVIVTSVAASPGLRIPASEPPLRLEAGEHLATRSIDDDYGRRE